MESTNDQVTKNPTPGDAPGEPQIGIPDVNSIRDSINKSASEITDPNVLASVTLLRKRRMQAVTDSLLMVNHAAENGLELKQDDVKAILDMAEAINTAGKLNIDSNATVNLESQFWTSLSHISNLIKPANAIAIRERSDFLSLRPNSSFASTIGIYKGYFWLTLILTLFMHSYYFFLGATLTDAQNSIQRLDIARTAAFTAMASIKDDTPQVDRDLTINIGNVCDALDIWRNTNTLLAWVTFQWTGSILAINKIRETDDNYSMLCKPGKILTVESYNNLSQLKVIDSVTQGVNSMAMKVRDAVGQFILPLLYGMLGAIASIIRDLATSIRQIRYSTAFGFEYGLKIPLGALAGATVGLVVAPGTINSAFGLTMLGAAFGFGYSVDVFFTLLDGLIGRIAQVSASQGDAPTKPGEPTGRGSG